MIRNSLDLKTQLKVVEVLKKKEPWQDMTIEQITKEVEAELQIPLTVANIRNIIKAAEIKTKSSSPEERLLQIVCGAILNLYCVQKINIPNEFYDICKSLKNSGAGK